MEARLRWFLSFARYGVCACRNACRSTYVQHSRVSDLYVLHIVEICGARQNCLRRSLRIETADHGKYLEMRREVEIYLCELN